MLFCRYCPGNCTDSAVGYSCNYVSEENFQVEQRPNRSIIVIDPNEDANNECPGDMVAVETDIG